MTKKKFHHLFITYDGLLDPLGRSQIIPYLKSIAKPERKIKVLSFEKNKNIKLKKINSVKQELLKSNILWKYNKFSENYGKIGKIYDLVKMFFFSISQVACIAYSIKHRKSCVMCVHLLCIPIISHSTVYTYMCLRLSTTCTHIASHC